jgi:hypothetical protein
MPLLQCRGPFLRDRFNIPYSTEFLTNQNIQNIKTIKIDFIYKSNNLQYSCHSPYYYFKKFKLDCLANLRVSIFLLHLIGLCKCSRAFCWLAFKSFFSIKCKEYRIATKRSYLPIRKIINIQYSAEWLLKTYSKRIVNSINFCLSIQMTTLWRKLQLAANQESTGRWQFKGAVSRDDGWDEALKYKNKPGLIVANPFARYANGINKLIFNSKLKEYFIDKLNAILYVLVYCVRTATLLIELSLMIKRIILVFNSNILSCALIYCIYTFCYISHIKETVSRDFRPPFFFINRWPLGPW